MNENKEYINTVLTIYNSDDEEDVEEYRLKLTPEQRENIRQFCYIMNDCLAIYDLRVTLSNYESTDFQTLEEMAEKAYKKI